MDYKRVLKIFLEYKEAQRAQQMKRYMRNQFDFIGVSSPLRLQITKQILKSLNKDSFIDWGFIKSCWSASYREMKYFVISYLLHLKQNLNRESLNQIEYLLLTDSWWDTIDALREVVAYVVLKYPAAKEEMLNWSRHDSIWVRRSAIIHQLLFKDKTDTGLLTKIVLNNLNSKEFFINKAIGWALREYSKTDSVWVVNFIENNKNELSKLSVKEASKYLK